jgi:hypothetical protein
MLASINVTCWWQLVYILSLLFRLILFNVSFFLSSWCIAWSFYRHSLSFFSLLFFLINFCFVCCFILYKNKTSHFTSWCCSFRSMYLVSLFFRTYSPFRHHMAYVIYVGYSPWDSFDRESHNSYFMKLYLKQDISCLQNTKLFYSDTKSKSMEFYHNWTFAECT